MKHLLTSSLILLACSLLAQDAEQEGRKFFDFFYLEGQVGSSITIHPEINIRSNWARSIGAGISFHERHSAGIAHSFWAKSVRTGNGGYNYAYANWGLRYRFEATDRLQLYLGAGSVDRYRTSRLTYCSNDIHEVDNRASDRFYIETGIRCRVFGPLLAGFSFAATGNMIVDKTLFNLDCPDIRQELRVSERGIRMLTLDLALVLQAWKR